MECVRYIGHTEVGLTIRTFVLHQMFQFAQQSAVFLLRGARPLVHHCSSCLFNFVPLLFLLLNMTFHRFAGMDFHLYGTFTFS